MVGVALYRSPVRLRPGVRCHRHTGISKTKGTTGFPQKVALAQKRLETCQGKCIIETVTFSHRPHRRMT